MSPQSEHTVPTRAVAESARCPARWGIMTVLISDKPSDNAFRQRHMERDALRRHYLATCTNPTQRDGVGQDRQARICICPPGRRPPGPRRLAGLGVDAGLPE